MLRDVVPGAPPITPITPDALAALMPSLDSIPRAVTLGDALEERERSDPSPEVTRRFFAMCDQMNAPRVRYVPTPRIRIYRPNGGRSVRGRRVRTSRRARSPGREPDRPRRPDVARPGGSVSMRGGRR